jgi:hypothetical protein
MVHFEEAFYTGPPHDEEAPRKNWKENPRLVNFSKAEVFDIIDSRQSVEDLVTLIGRPELEVVNHWYWSFKGLCNEGPRKYLHNRGISNFGRAKDAIRCGLLNDLLLHRLYNLSKPAAAHQLCA